MKFLKAICKNRKKLVWSAIRKQKWPHHRISSENDKYIYIYSLLIITIALLRTRFVTFSLIIMYDNHLQLNPHPRVESPPFLSKCMLLASWWIEESAECSFNRGTLILLAPSSQPRSTEQTSERCPTSNPAALTPWRPWTARRCGIFLGLPELASTWRARGLI